MNTEFPTGGVINVTAPEFAFIHQTMVGVNPLKEAQEACRHLGIDWDKMKFKRWDVRVVPIVERRVEACDTIKTQGTPSPTSKAQPSPDCTVVRCAGGSSAATPS